MKDDFLMLALDTSQTQGSVAVARGENVLCEILFDASDTHSATLMPAVDMCMRTAGAVTDDIDGFAVVTGPGSFTGLRIGLATVKAFAAVRRRPVFAASSLEVLASAFPFAGPPVLPLLDARRGEVYAALYDVSSGSPVELEGPRDVKPEDTGRLVDSRSAGGAVILCGSGAARYRDILSASFGKRCLFAGPAWSLPSAALLAMLVRGRRPVAYEDLAGLEPLYIRPPDAKIPAGMKLREGGGGG